MTATFASLIITQILFASTFTFVCQDKLYVLLFFLLGLLGIDLHRVHRQSELPSGRTGGKPLHMLGSSGRRFPGQTLL